MLGNTKVAYVLTVLNKYLGEYVSTDKNISAKEKPLLLVSTRAKKSSSIREKVASKFSKVASDECEQFATQLTHELSKYFPLLPDTSVKDTIHDIERILNYSFSDQVKLPPYENVDLYFEDILDEIYHLDKFENEITGMEVI